MTSKNSTATKPDFYMVPAHIVEGLLNTQSNWCDNMRQLKNVYEAQKGKKK